MVFIDGKSCPQSLFSPCFQQALALLGTLFIALQVVAAHPAIRVFLCCGCVKCEVFNQVEALVGSMEDECESLIQAFCLACPKEHHLFKSCFGVSHHWNRSPLVWAACSEGFFCRVSGRGLTSSLKATIVSHGSKEQSAAGQADVANCSSQTPRRPWCF